MLAVPNVVGVTLERAMPFVGVTGDAGSNEPDTPRTEKLTGLVAFDSVATLAS